MKIKLYIEGGGDSPLQDTLFRQGWQEFFKRAGLEGRMPATVRGGGREQTFDAFQTAVRNRREGELPLLLVDAEDRKRPDDDEWQHLKRRDGWDRPVTAGAEDAYLMIACMESWFLSDREALAGFFHNCWRDQALPQWPDLEAVPKADVLERLAQATVGCGKKAYAKGKRSFEILKVIDPGEVARRCPGARRLLERLRQA